MVHFSAAEALSIGADAIHLKNRPLPDAPTGYYDWEITTDPSDDREGHSRITNLIDRLESIKAKGLFKPNLSQVDAFFDSVMHPMAIDDRKGAFTTGLGILARLDPNGDLSKKMNNGLIDMLYNTVPHPPASYVGPRDSFRRADGGGNNLLNPDLGRAGMPYARSVQGKAGLPRSSLPDAGLVFDTILKRQGIQDHPGGMSSMVFAFALIVTHSVFRTDPKNIHINNASSYLDLSPLYGDNQEAQDQVRDKASGRGLLFPDTFSEERLLFLEPATNVILVLFSRNHNYIAKRILKINECRRWSDPPPSDPEKFALQDEEIFQTARLINCGHFMSAIMGDYVTGFLGMSEGWNWNMNPFDIIKTDDLKVDRGLGNHVSVEFNIIYRWHATISAKDEKWTEGVFRKVFGDKPFEELSSKDMGKLYQALNKTSKPSERTFAGLKRGPDGTFSDDDLAKILYAATESPAGAFRARGTPTFLRLVEIMGIEQSRAWGVCTMNEFRKFLGLREFKTFEEWNPDPEIAGAARRLYGHVDNMELYTGLQAESTMPLTETFRFACGYTITRAILGDAIALVRGDRFYTSDFTPANLTTWGFYDCQRDMNNGGLGGQIPKLLLRHLPRHFPWNSVYTLYPFFTPQKMEDSLTRQKIAKKYTFKCPKALPITKCINTFTGIKAVFSDPSRFKVIYEIPGYGSPLVFDEARNRDADKAIIHAIFPDEASLDQHATAFAASVVAKIKEKSWKYPNISGNYVDIVKDVINAVAVHIAADKVAGIPLKTMQNSSGIFTENEFFDMLATLYTVTFLAFDQPENHFGINEAATQAEMMIEALTARSLIEISPSASPNFLGGVIARVSSFFRPPNKKPWYPFLSALTATGRPVDELIGNIISIAIATVDFAHAAVNVIDFYLDDARTEERKAIVELVANKGPQSEALLSGYVREAMRLQPQYSGLWRGAVEDAIIDQGPGHPPMEVKAGDRIYASFKNAYLNPVEFPEPTKVNPTRQAVSYYLNGTAFRHCPGEASVHKTIVEIVKVVFSLENVRRAPGDAGDLHRLSEVLHETEVDSFVQRNGTVSPWPGCMYIVYDD